MHYLEETRPSRPLMPQDVHKRAKVHITFISLSFMLLWITIHWYFNQHELSLWFCKQFNAE